MPTVAQELSVDSGVGFASEEIVVAGDDIVGVPRGLVGYADGRAAKPGGGAGPKPGGGAGSVMVLFTTGLDTGSGACPGG